MKSLEDLITLPGAIAAFECSASGALLRHQLASGSELRAEILDLIAHMCAANVSIATMQAHGWDMTTRTTSFSPIRNFTLIGMDWSVSVASAEEADEKGPGLLRGVVSDNRRVSYQGVSEALAAS